MRLACLVVMVGACGRIGFEPHADFDTDLDADIGTDVGGGDAADAAPGAVGETCMSARVLMVGDTRANESLATATSDHPVTCAAGPDLVYQFELATQGSRRLSLAADFGGRFWLTTSCPPPTSVSCTSFGQNTMLDRVYAAGVHYVGIVKVSGTGSTFSISLD